MAQSIVDYNYYRVIDEAVYGNGVNEHNVPKEEAGKKSDNKDDTDGGKSDSKEDGSHSGAGDSDSDGTGRDDRSSDNDSSDASQDIGTGGDAR